MNETLQPHPLADAFPKMLEAEFDALCKDIEANGCRLPVILFEGMILDGRHRYSACIATGTRFETEQYTGTDAKAFVLSLNAHRRHLTTAQKREAIAVLLKADPTQSDRTVAEKAGVKDHKLVGRVRKESVRSGALPQTSTRTYKDGRVLNTPPPVDHHLAQVQRQIDAEAKAPENIWAKVDAAVAKMKEADAEIRALRTPEENAAADAQAADGEAANDEERIDGIADGVDALRALIAANVKYANSTPEDRTNDKLCTAVSAARSGLSEFAINLMEWTRVLESEIEAAQRRAEIKVKTK